MGVMYKLAKSRNSELAVESFLKELSATPLFCKWIYVFDLAQIRFLTQSSHLSGIYTTTRRTLAWLSFVFPPRIELRIFHMLGQVCKALHHGATKLSLV